MRSYTIGDADKIHPLAEKIFSYEGALTTFENISEILRDPTEHGWYIEVDAKPIAFLVYSDDYKKEYGAVWSYLDYIGTDADYASYGYAKILLTHYLAMVDANEQTSYLHVVNNSNSDKLIQWYTKNGFKIVGKSPSGQSTSMIRFANLAAETQWCGAIKSIVSEWDV